MHMLYVGELFFIGYEMDKKPACVWYAGLDKEGVLKFDVKVPLQVSLPRHIIERGGFERQSSALLAFGSSGMINFVSWLSRCGSRAEVPAGRHGMMCSRASRSASACMVVCCIGGVSCCAGRSDDARHGNH